MTIYTVKKVTEDSEYQVFTFIMRLRKELFPMLPYNDSQVRKHLKNLLEEKQKKSTCFAAFLEDGTVIGTIGIEPYDGRFSMLQKFYQNIPMAEINKCYIDVNYRRLGIGTKLYQAIHDFSILAGYEKLYLHTHPFLPGAIPFWKSLGFQERFQEEDPIWNTLHMDKYVK